MLDIAIIISTVLALILAARNNWWTWPVNIVSASILMYLFFNDGMYISFLNNLYTVIISIVSCFTWKRNSEHNKEFVKRFAIDKILVYSIYYIGMCVLLWCLNHAISSNPILDAIGVASFILGTYLLSKHHLESWMLFLIGDVIYIITGFTCENYIYTLLYCIMIGVDLYGFFNYKKQLNNE